MKRLYALVKLPTLTCLIANELGPGISLKKFYFCLLSEETISEGTVVHRVSSFATSKLSFWERDETSHFLFFISHSLSSAGSICTLKNDICRIFVIFRFRRDIFRPISGKHSFNEPVSLSLARIKTSWGKLELSSEPDKFCNIYRSSFSEGDFLPTILRDIIQENLSLLAKSIQRNEYHFNKAGGSSCEVAIKVIASSPGFTESVTMISAERCHVSNSCGGHNCLLPTNKVNERGALGVNWGEGVHLKRSLLWAGVYPSEKIGTATKDWNVITGQSKGCCLFLCSQWVEMIRSN